MNPQNQDDWKPGEPEPGLLLRKIIAALSMVAATGIFLLVVVWPVVGIFMKH